MHCFCIVGPLSFAFHFINCYSNTLKIVHGQHLSDLRHTHHARHPCFTCCWIYYSVEHTHKDRLKERHTAKRIHLLRVTKFKYIKDLGGVCDS